MSEKNLLTMAEVAKHSSRDDAWIVYKGKAYDVTEFLANHPGGEEVLLDTAGRDATRDFDDVGHSDDAIKMMVDMLKGEMEPTAKGATPAPAPKKAETPKPKVGPTSESSSIPSWLAPVLLVLAAVGYYFYSH